MYSLQHENFKVSLINFQIGFCYLRELSYRLKHILFSEELIGTTLLCRRYKFILLLMELDS